MKRSILVTLATFVLALASIPGCGGMSKSYGPMAARTADGRVGDGSDELGITSIAADELWIVARDDDYGTTEMAADDVPASPALSAVLPNEEQEIPLPLKHTAVSARIHAYIAAVRVEQQYHNPYDQKIEVVYVFPLPQDAAVSEFLMKIGERTIRGIIREREEAERIYEEARSQGYVASLLTQERPNVFTQKVANIEPGKDIDVELVYYNTLPYRDGAYAFTFPTVVGPRFNPPGSTDGVGAVPRGAHGASGQSTEVQYLAPGEQSGHDLSLAIDLEAGVAIESVTSPSHQIDVERVSASRRKIALSAGATTPDRDFLMRFEVAGDQIKSAFLAHEDQRGGYFTFVLTPPDDLDRMERAPVEHVFVLDCSGSMSGRPLRTAKHAVERVLDKLDQRDTFQIIRFSSDASTLGPAPIPATERNKQKGRRYLKRLNSAGGTMMIEGIKAALDFPHEDGKVRIVTFMTDGYIGNEAEILAAIHNKLGRSRIFSFGVGSAPNRYLLERMAKIGQGAVAYVGEGDDRDDREAVDAFYDRISHPALSDIEVDWGEMEVSEVYPSRIPDLWSGRPVVVTGRIRGAIGDRIRVHGRVGGRSESFETKVLADSERRRPSIAQVWARMKILDLADRSLWSNDRAELTDRIRRLALKYSLMSKFTAFVAVDSSRKTEGDHGYTVAQPVPVPHGVKYETTVAADGGQ
jgi:Ca-activated chloride channel family protein